LAQAGQNSIVIVMKSIKKDDRKDTKRTLGTPAYVQLSSGLSIRLIRQNKSLGGFVGLYHPSRMPSMHRTLRSKQSWSKRLPLLGPPSVAQLLNSSSFVPLWGLVCLVTANFVNSVKSAQSILSASMRPALV
jgi:hypothetical protein